MNEVGYHVIMVAGSALVVTSKKLLTAGLWCYSQAAKMTGREMAKVELYEQEDTPCR